VRVREVAESIQYGHTASAISRIEGPRFLRITDIQNGGVDWNSVPSCDIGAEEVPKYKLSAGDLVFARTGATTGKSFLIRDCPNAVFASYLIRVRASKEVDPRYLALFFQSPDYWQQIERGKRGIGQPNVNGKILGEIELPLPGLTEQQRTVAEIETQLTRLEAGVAALRRGQTNLKRYRAAVLKAACEGRLVPTEAELARAENRKFETGEELLTRILTDRRQWFTGRQVGAQTKKKYVEPAQAETTGLPVLPPGWTWGTWNQVSNWVTYGFTRPMPHVETGIPIITAKGVNKGRIDFEGAHLTTNDAYVKLSEKDRPQPEDILITKDGTIGRAAVVNTDRDFCINQSVAVIWLRSCPIERKFMLTVIESELTQKPILAKARGVAIQHLSITDFAKMAIPIPPLAEQTRIVAEVERRLSVVEELKAVATANLVRATRLRQAILHRAFTRELLC
jgi:type I restriction enzyme S subunit